jgi:ATP-dependent DNA helicase DinG
MNLSTGVEEAFAPNGVLSRSVEQFVARAGQAEMAMAVARAIEHSDVLVVEASTGVGKTYAYLVPALMSGERVLLSTATKALQDQLFSRDLPGLVKVLGTPVTVALLKGRASYLCSHRLDLARQHADPSDRGFARSIARIEQWSKITRTGDLAELPGLDENSPLIPLVTSTRENCLGGQCPKFRSCHVNLARKDALSADIIVINHHLFFADLAVRESGVAELLPSVRVAIFDEAHQLNEIGTQFLGSNLTTGQLLDFSRDMLAAGLQLARGLVDWQTVAGRCETAARQLRLCVGSSHSGAKLRWINKAPDNVGEADWDLAIEGLREAVIGACEALDTVGEIAPDFGRLHDRATTLAARIESFVDLCKPGCVRWLDVGSQLRLVESPLDIAVAVRSKMLDAPGQGGKAWVFTSATLGYDENLTWFTQPCGLADATILRVDSPFDYARQAALYVPRDFVKPSDPGHSSQVAASVAEWAGVIGGRTMVLTTSLRALRTISDILTSRFQGSDRIEVLVQGAMPKRALVERFRQGDSNGQCGCVMVASVSFWEGIDMPGDSLQLVVIDKLPFPTPNDPMAEARTRALEAQGRNPFNNYFLPEAAVALKQGAGRLIRRETDQGVLVVCDSRLATMSYGKRLVKALPPMLRLHNMVELQERLVGLTRIDTRDSAQV